MRKALCAAALVLALTCTARAGWVTNGIEAPTPSPTPTETTQDSVSTDDKDATGATDELTLIVLTTLVSVLP